MTLQDIRESLWWSWPGIWFRWTIVLKIFLIFHYGKFASPCLPDYSANFKRYHSIDWKILQPLNKWNTSLSPDKTLESTKFVKRTAVECPGLRPRRRLEHHWDAGRGIATYSVFDLAIESESDNIFSCGSPRALKNERRIETALVTTERVILKREDLGTSAGESGKGWGGWWNDFER
jgi:hypothetical protein